MTKFTELQCWLLADELRKEIVAICARKEVARHWRFCDSFQETISSVCRNLAEGFTRGTSADIVRFFVWALASLAEVQDHLVDSRTRQFIGQQEFDRLFDISEHVKATGRNFMKPHQEKLTRERERRRTPRKRT
jgi:four helix bundle protein